MNNREFGLWIAFCVLSVGCIVFATVKIEQQEKAYNNHRSVGKTDYVRKWLHSKDSASFAVYKN